MYVYEKEKEGAYTYTYWKPTTYVPGIDCFVYIFMHI